MQRLAEAMPHAVRKCHTVTDPGPRPDGDDVALVLAIASARDRAAFVTLFGRFGPRLKSWFMRGGTPAPQAEDQLGQCPATDSGCEREDDDESGCLAHD